MKRDIIKSESKRNAFIKLGALAIALPFAGKKLFARIPFKSDKTKINPISVTPHPMAVERSSRSKKI